MKHFGKAAALKTASVEWREGQEPSEGCSTRGQGHVAAPCQPKVTSTASNPPLGCTKQLSSMAWILGGLGVWECKAPTQAGKQQGLGCPPGLGLHPWVISMEEQFLVGSCALDVETSPLCFRYHFICFSTPGWGCGNSPFFNLWAFSIADQALQRQKLHPQSGCLLCRVHSPWLAYLVKSHSCSPFSWWHQGLCHQSHPGMMWGWDHPFPPHLQTARNECE